VDINKLSAEVQVCLLNVYACACPALPCAVGCFPRHQYYSETGLVQSTRFCEATAGEFSANGRRKKAGRTCEGPSSPNQLLPPPPHPTERLHIVALPATLSQVLLLVRRPSIYLLISLSQRLCLCFTTLHFPPLPSRCDRAASCRFAPMTQCPSPVSFSILQTSDLAARLRV
jgi:hypothetical protein